MTSLIPAIRTARLVTLTGLPGVGKTAVAAAAVRSLRGAYPDGVWPVALGQLQDGALVEHTVAQVLMVPDTLGEKQLGSLVGQLQARRLLLMLDTCEHLIGGCERLVAGLLASCPGVRVIATSREPLRLPGEHVVPVRPLTLGHAVVLFSRRAREAAPDFKVTPDNRALVASVCRRLDRLPLAIELAARQLGSMSLDRLRAALASGFSILRDDSTPRDDADSPRRHQSLYAAIGWSHELCTPQERLLWARLSVFAEPVKIPDAIAVCADRQLPASAVADALLGLAGRSVVLTDTDPADGTRYRVPGTIRSFGATMLLRLGEAADQRRRYLDWLADFG